MRFRAMIMVVVGLSIAFLRAEATQSRSKRNSFADKLHHGIKFAGSILGEFNQTHVIKYYCPHSFITGIDAAADVANLVAKAFGTNSTTPFKQGIGKRFDSPTNLPPLADNAPIPGILSHLLQIIGLDSDKIGALALNGIVFIAQLVSTGFTKFIPYLRQHLWDLTMIIEYIVRRIKESNQSPGVTTFGV